MSYLGGMSDIFESDCDAIINTVNCVGVMGGGLAAAFRERYPRLNQDYQTACANGQVQVGKMWNWFIDDELVWAINFPTKDDWRNPSELTYIKDGLQDLRKVIADLRLSSIAIPPLGCGLGGLNWSDVLPMIKEALGDLDGVRIDIYPPNNEDKYTL